MRSLVTLEFERTSKVPVSSEGPHILWKGLSLSLPPSLSPSLPPSLSLSVSLSLSLSLSISLKHTRQMQVHERAM